MVGAIPYSRFVWHELSSQITFLKPLFDRNQLFDSTYSYVKLYITEYYGKSFLHLLSLWKTTLVKISALKCKWCRSIFPQIPFFVLVDFSLFRLIKTDEVTFARLFSRSMVVKYQDLFVWRQSLAYLHIVLT